MKLETNPYSYARWFERIGEMSPAERLAMKLRMRADYERMLEQYERERNA